MKASRPTQEHPYIVAPVAGPPGETAQRAEGDPRMGPPSTKGRRRFYGESTKKKIETLFHKKVFEGRASVHTARDTVDCAKPFGEGRS